MEYVKKPTAIGVFLVAMLVSLLTAGRAFAEEKSDLDIATERAPRGDAPFLRYDSKDKHIEHFLSLSASCYGARDKEGRAIYASLRDYLEMTSDERRTQVFYNYRLTSARGEITGNPRVIVNQVAYHRDGDRDVPLYRYRMFYIYRLTDSGAAYDGWDADDLITGKEADHVPPSMTNNHPMGSMMDSREALCNILISDALR